MREPILEHANIEATGHPTAPESRAATAVVIAGRWVWRLVIESLSRLTSER